eukprot:12333866-Heterocapsa_arctica.AAC.1
MESGVRHMQERSCPRHGLGQAREAGVQAEADHQRCGQPGVGGCGPCPRLRLEAEWARVHRLGRRVRMLPVQPHVRPGPCGQSE